MNHFKYSLKEPALSLIINGTKKIEGRLCKNTFKNINSGDIITFYNKDSKVDVIVTKVVKFNNFGSMLINTVIKNTTPLATSFTKAINIYNNIYSKEDIKKYGVLAIYLKKIY